MKTLDILNGSASLLHLGLGIGFGLYFMYLNRTNPNNPVQGIETSVRQHELVYTGENTVNAPITRTWVSREQYIFDVKNIQWLLVLFFLITAGFHAFYYFNSGNSGLYTVAITDKNNYFRWIEYSITATMMLFIIAYSSGVKDIEVYTLLFATNIAMIAQGQLIEVAIREKGDWKTPMLVGFLLLICEFVSIFRALNQRFKEINSYIESHPIATGGFNIPKWLAYLGIVLFIMFSSFGFISLWGAYHQEQYETVEMLYIIFSFVAKATLGFFLAFGLSQRQNRQMN
jgi:hypothetical protein